MIRKICANLFDILFPPQCVSCASSVQRDEILCPMCVSTLSLRSGFLCSVCGRRLPELKVTCHKNAFPIAAATDYRSKAVHELVRALKYRHIVSVGDLIASLIKTFAEKNMTDISFDNCVIVPIPSSSNRERTRGYNQAEYIARLFIKKIGTSAPLLTHALLKKRDSLSQVTCADYKEREKNVLGSFCVRDAETILGKTVIIFDDVSTSGATMREAARELQRAGAKHIVGFVFAKA